VLQLERPDSDKETTRPTIVGRVVFEVTVFRHWRDAVECLKLGLQNAYVGGFRALGRILDGELDALAFLKLAISAGV
jgi:hypothetical protein